MLLVFLVFLLLGKMRLVRIRYRNKIHKRTVAGNFRGWYVMFSEGKEYRFERTDEGWLFHTHNAVPGLLSKLMSFAVLSGLYSMLKIPLFRSLFKFPLAS